MKIKWKEIYENNKSRRYSEVAGIKKEGVGVESNPARLAKKKPYYIILIVLIVAAVVFYVFRSDLKIALMVMGFLLLTGICFFIFNYYKLECRKDGLYIKFGMQQGLFNYDRIKNIYISRFNDSSYLLSIRTYNIVIRYEDNFNRLKELFFDASFLDKEQIIEFLNNFEVKETEAEKYKNFEKMKLLKKIGKIALIVIFIVAIGLWGFARFNG